MAIGQKVGTSKVVAGGTITKVNKYIFVIYIISCIQEKLQRKIMNKIVEFESMVTNEARKNPGHRHVDENHTHPGTKLIREYHTVPKCQAFINDCELAKIIREIGLWIHAN